MLTGQSRGVFYIVICMLLDMISIVKVMIMI